MVAGGMAMRGVHSVTRFSMWARPWSRESWRSAVSWAAVRAEAARASGRTAQTAATQGRWVRLVH